MSELRRDPLTGDTVLIAASRAGRPGSFRRSAPAGAVPSAGDAAAPARDPGCPFCPGNEDRTPPEVARTPPGDPGTPGWSVRVFPNLYPLVGGNVDSDTPTSERSVSGRHEVVVLSPRTTCPSVASTTRRPLTCSPSHGIGRWH
ncbi:MAG: hypothetical protein M5U31_08645 [Acidimicrobiia bacterium]|nr:hypothetical protein [Acidimicrobiia bacterium]